MAFFGSKKKTEKVIKADAAAKEKATALPGDALRSEVFSDAGNPSAELKEDDFDYTFDDDLDYDYPDPDERADIKKGMTGEEAKEDIPANKDKKKDNKKAKDKLTKEDKKKLKEEKKEEKKQKKEDPKDTEEGADAADTEENEEEKSGFLPIILCVLIAVFGMGFAGYQIYSIQSEYSAAEQEYENLTKYTRVIDAAEIEEMSVEEPPQKKKKKEELARNFTRSSFPNIEVDFDGLSEENPDIVAWLYMGSVDINYPVVRGEDNEYYLHHTFEDMENGSGCVFMDSEVNPDLTSWNTFFYGHNMKNGTMFGSLKRLLREDGLYESDPYVYVFMREGIYRYKIFSYYLDKPDSKMYYTCKTFKEYRQYVRTALEMSQHECNVPATENDNMITLVTCSGSGAGKKREFVHATFIDRYLYEDPVDEDEETEDASSVKDNKENKAETEDKDKKDENDTADTSSDSYNDTGENGATDADAGANRENPAADANEGAVRDNPNEGANRPNPSQ
ncbi:MAG: sortase [Lachnospiraceae bacterium]|nr:sortase [Lachnospiraceae bacterium]